MRERLQNTDTLNEFGCNGSSDQRTGPKSAHRNAGNKAPSVGEPFHQHRNWNDIAESQSDASDEPVAEIQPPELIRRKAGQKDSEPVQKPACSDLRVSGSLPLTSGSMRKARSGFTKPRLRTISIDAFPQMPQLDAAKKLRRTSLESN